MLLLCLGGQVWYLLCRWVNLVFCYMGSSLVLRSVAVGLGTGFTGIELVLESVVMGLESE